MKSCCDCVKNQVSHQKNFISMTTFKDTLYILSMANYNFDDDYAALENNFLAQQLQLDAAIEEQTRLQQESRQQLILELERQPQEIDAKKAEREEIMCQERKKKEETQPRPDDVQGVKDMSSYIKETRSDGPTQDKEYRQAGEGLCEKGKYQEPSNLDLTSGKESRPTSGKESTQGSDLGSEEKTRQEPSSKEQSGQKRKKEMTEKKGESSGSACARGKDMSKYKLDVAESTKKRKKDGKSDDPNGKRRKGKELPSLIDFSVQAIIVPEPEVYVGETPIPVEEVQAGSSKESIDELLQYILPELSEADTTPLDAIQPFDPAAVTDQEVPIFSPVPTNILNQLTINDNAFSEGIRRVLEMVEPLIQKRQKEAEESSGRKPRASLQAFILNEWTHWTETTKDRSRSILTQVNHNNAAIATNYNHFASQLASIHGKLEFLEEKIVEILYAVKRPGPQRKDNRYFPGRR